MFKLKFQHLHLLSLLLIIQLAISPSLQASPAQKTISATRAADFIHAVIQTNRNIYSQYIVERLQKSTSILATENWKSENTLPLPAQFLMTSSQRVNSRNRGIRYRLLSLWPINNKNGAQSKKEKSGLKAVAKNPDKPYVWVDQRNGQSEFNAIYADQAVTDSCVQCHNNHPDSPKKDFLRGDVMGGVIISFPLRDTERLASSGKPGITLARVADYVHAILEADRTVYSKDVVDRLQTQGVVYASENWWKDNTLPLPAQFMLNASELIQNMNLGMSFKLISAWPINPFNKPANDFERVGLKQVTSKSANKHMGIVKKGNSSYFTALYPDIAVAPSCVNCHNQHMRSPKTDFKLNDVIGGVVISIKLEEN